MEDFIIKNFQRDGYITVTDKQIGLDIKHLTKSIIFSLKGINKDYRKSKEKTDLIKFINEITKEEKQNKISSKIYEFLPSMPELYRFCSDTRLISFIKKFGIKNPSLGTVPMIRIDRPNDKFYSTPWHQDYWFSFSSLDSIVIWIPMGEISEDHGYLKILEKSHNIGLIPYQLNKDSNEPLQIKHKIDSSKIKEVKINFGEILIFKQSLLHKSGINSSDEPRVTMQLRYNKMDNQKELFSTFRAVHSNFVIANQKENL